MFPNLKDNICHVVKTTWRENVFDGPWYKFNYINSGMWKDSPNFEIACDIFYDTVTWNRKLAKERPCVRMNLFTKLFFQFGLS